jgi:hypothetical protein
MSDLKGYFDQFFIDKLLQGIMLISYEFQKYKNNHNHRTPDLEFVNYLFFKNKFRDIAQTGKVVYLHKKQHCHANATSFFPFHDQVG